MFNRTFSVYNDKKITYYLGNIRLQIDGLNELRKFDITYLIDSNIILRLL